MCTALASFHLQDLKLSWHNSLNKISRVAVKTIAATIQKNLTKTEQISRYAEYCKSARILIKNHGQRKCPPTTKELEAIYQLKPLMLKVYFPPGFNSEYRAINATSTYSANDALNAIMPKLGLEKKQFYSLYKVFSNGEACAIPEKMYLTEVLWEAEEEIAVKNKENSSNNNNNLSYKIEFRKKVWLNPEEDEVNLAAQYLTFAQAIPNLLNGYYEFDLDKTLELISLHHHFLHADSPLKDLSTLVKGYCQGGRDKFGKDFENKVQDAIKKMKTNNPNISKDDCVAKFIQIFQTSEYYGTSFFIVGQSFDSSLPTKLILGVNKECIHLFNFQSKKILKTYKYSEVGYWSSSKDTFTMKVGSMVDGSRFVCETTHGKEITELLEMYVEAAVHRKKKKTKTEGEGKSSSLRKQHQFHHRQPSSEPKSPRRHSTRDQKKF